MDLQMFSPVAKDTDARAATEDRPLIGMTARGQQRERTSSSDPAVPCRRVGGYGVADGTAITDGHISAIFQRMIIYRTAWVGAPITKMIKQGRIVRGQFPKADRTVRHCSWENCGFIGIFLVAM